MSDTIFIGVAWPYANGSLHLGHIAGCYLPADIFARYNRLKGRDVLMVSGSDEHGTPITITADAEKTTPQKVVDRYNKEHTENMKQLGISFDLFTRTTTENHKTVVQDIFLTLYKNGYIYEKSVEAFYCENCSRFLPDRYIEGECPHCHYENARGDQCDNCGMLLNTKELLKVKCKLCGGTPIIRTSDHLFFALSKFESKLLDWIEDKKHWKSNVIKFTRNWLKDGLKDRAITRDLSWGVNVPASDSSYGIYVETLPEFYYPTADPWYDPDDENIFVSPLQVKKWNKIAEDEEGVIKDPLQFEKNCKYVRFDEDKWGMIPPISGFENKRIYVWFDAVIGYLAASKEWSQKKGEPLKWEEWWKNKDARHYYFLAKDNIPFHSIIWPSILMGYDESLNLPYDIPANEYLCLSGEQFSKSRCVAVWVPDILKQFDADAIRYYLSINMPENKDSNWLWNDFVAKNNDELVGTYGNFIHRVVTFTSKNFGNIPKMKNLEEIDKEALKKIEEACIEVGNSIEHCKFKKGLRAAMNLAQYGNYYFDQNQPWKLVKTDKERCGTVLHICLKLVQALAVLTLSYLPFSSDTIWKMLGNKDSIKSWDDAQSTLKEGTHLEKPTPVFKKLLLEDIVVDSDPFSKLDLRVAKIVEVTDHPQADKLYVLQLDIGPLGKRTIVAGIKPYYSQDELKGKSIIIISNLKPVKLRGVESKGMLLAAEDDMGVCSLLNPKDATPGSEIFIEGVPREPAAVLEFDDFKKVVMIIEDDQKAMYDGKPLKSKNDTVVADKKVKKGAKIL